MGESDRQEEKANMRILHQWLLLWPRGAPFCPLCWTPPRSRQNHPFLGISQKKTGELSSCPWGHSIFLHLSSELRILSLLGSHLSLRCYPAYVRQQWTLPLVKDVYELAKVVLVKTEDADGEWAGSNIFEAWQLCYSLVGRCVILPSRTHQCRRSISFLLFLLSLFSRLFLSNFTH